MAYELLTGRKPFGSAGRAILTPEQAATSSPPALPGELAVPDGIEALLRAALAVDPDDRPQTAGAFADALLSPGGKQWAPPGPEGRTSERTTSARPAPPAVWLSAVVVLLVTAVLTWRLG